jgi:hypothetical protein
MATTEFGRAATMRNVESGNGTGGELHLPKEEAVTA